MPKRDPLDKFYTKEHIARDCVRKFRDVVPFDSNDAIIEPSVGSGSFYSAIRDLWETAYFIDIAPEIPDGSDMDINAMDFLTCDPPDRIGEQKMHVIGNPPFGRQSVLARRFIRKIMTFQRRGDAIGFILPISFRKESLSRIFSGTYTKIHDSDIEDNAFILGGSEYNVRCVFQVWMRDDHAPMSVGPSRHLADPRKLHIGESDNWNYVTKDLALASRDAQKVLAIRRVGVNAGRATSDIDDCNVQCFDFVQLKCDIDASRVVDAMSVQIYENNAVGPKSLTKKEIGARLDIVIGEILGPAEHT